MQGWALSGRAFRAEISRLCCTCGDHGAPGDPRSFRARCLNHAGEFPFSFARPAWRCFVFIAGAFFARPLVGRCLVIFRVLRDEFVVPPSRPLLFKACIQAGRFVLELPLPPSAALEAMLTRAC